MCNGRGLRASAEMADVVRGLEGLDAEAAVRGHRELLAGAVVLRGRAARELDAAAASDDLHALGRGGLEGERARQDHADGLPSAVCRVHGVAHAAAFEED